MNIFTAPICGVYDGKKISSKFSYWQSCFCSYLNNRLVDVMYNSYPAVYDDGWKNSRAYLISSVHFSFFPGYFQILTYFFDFLCSCNSIFLEKKYCFGSYSSCDSWIAKAIIFVMFHELASVFIFIILQFWLIIWTHSWVLNSYSWHIHSSQIHIHICFMKLLCISAQIHGMWNSYSWNSCIFHPISYSWIWAVWLWIAMSCMNCKLWYIHNYIYI